MARESRSCKKKIVILPVLLLLCSDSRNDVPPVPQRNVSIAAERGAVRPSTEPVLFFIQIILYTRGNTRLITSSVKSCSRVVTYVTVKLIQIDN